MQFPCPHHLAGRCCSCSVAAEPPGQDGGTDLAACLAHAVRLKESHLHAELAALLAQIPSGTPVVQPMFAPQTVLPSRAKAKIAVSGNLAQPILGLIDDNYHGIELLDCPLHFPLLNRLIRHIREMIPRYKLFPYDINTRRGELKALLLVCRRDETQALVRFVLRSSEALLRLKKAALELQDAFPEAQAVSANIQPLPAAILEGTEEHLLSSAKYIWEDYGICRIALAPQCFLQVTPETASALYAHAAAWTKRLESRRILDLYCGAGAFSLACTAHAASLRGLEISPRAVECARLGAADAALHTVDFICADADSDTESLREFEPDTVILNPPRRGASPALIGALLHSQAKHIIYSSCNSGTLCRDLKLLTDGFDLIELASFDMFPMTKHCEVVAVLNRREKKN